MGSIAILLADPCQGVGHKSSTNFQDPQGGQGGEGSNRSKV